MCGFFFFFRLSLLLLPRPPPSPPSFLVHCRDPCTQKNSVPPWLLEKRRSPLLSSPLFSSLLISFPLVSSLRNLTVCSVNPDFALRDCSAVRNQRNRSARLSASREKEARVNDESTDGCCPIVRPEQYRTRIVCGFPLIYSRRELVVKCEQKSCVLL